MAKVRVNQIFKRIPYKQLLAWDTLLVIAVFFAAFILPVFPTSWGRTPTRICFTLIFLSGFMCIEKRTWIVLYLVVGATIMEWVSGLLEWMVIMDLSRFLGVLFFTYVVIALIREMATAKVVTARVILASISGYLLLGLIFSALLAAIMQRDPHAYNIPVVTDGSNDASHYLSVSSYYGFVTLATLGYGDVVPLKPYSRSLATLITITGQLYVATIIGILIGKFASTAHSGHNKDING